MNYRLTLLSESALQAFRDLVLPLASLRAAPEEEQRRRIQAALDGLALGTDERTAGGWLLEALSATGEGRRRLIGLATTSLPGIVLRRSEVQGLDLSRGTFDVHAWLLQATTQSAYLVPRSKAPRSAEFQSSHFRRYSWLSAAELAALPSSAYFEPLRERARTVGDAPQWPVERVDGYVEQCIRDAELILGWVAQGKRDGLAAVTCIDNTDWDFD